MVSLFYIIEKKEQFVKIHTEHSKLVWLFDATSFSFDLPFLAEPLGIRSVNTYNATESAKHTVSLAGNRNAGFQEKFFLCRQCDWPKQRGNSLKSSLCSM